MKKSKYIERIQFKRDVNREVLEDFRQQWDYMIKNESFKLEDENKYIYSEYE